MDAGARVKPNLKRSFMARTGDYCAAFSALKRRCIRDFFREAAFFLMIPFREAVSIFLIISRNASSASAVSFCRAKTTNFFALVLTELFTALFRIRRSSLCLCRFSAELLLPAKVNPHLYESFIITPLGPDRPTGSFKIRRTPFGTLAFLTFGDIFDLAVLEQGLHLDFAPTGTEKFLGRAGGTGVLAGLSHYFLLAGLNEPP
jgi:hypothetical protein